MIMKLNEFLKQIEFVREDGTDVDADVSIEIDGRSVDIDYVERDMDNGRHNTGPIIIVANTRDKNA